jgi:hypothetical protein
MFRTRRNYNRVTKEFENKEYYVPVEFNENEIVDTQSIYITAGVSETLREDLIFSKQKRTFMDDATVWNAYRYYRYIKDTFGDEGIIAPYMRCNAYLPETETIFDPNKQALVIQPRRDDAGNIIYTSEKCNHLRSSKTECPHCGAPSIENAYYEDNYGDDDYDEEVDAHVDDIDEIPNDEDDLYSFAFPEIGELEDTEVS